MPVRGARVLDMPESVSIVPYDDAWPRLFAGERERLASFLGPLSVVLEHIGSTAVSGLASKPIIDMVAGWPAETPVEACRAALSRAGYDDRGERGVPGRLYFRRGAPPAWHLHLVRLDGALWHQYLAFRDGLRHDPQLRARYAAAKARLAQAYADDRDAYVRAKSRVVRGLLGHIRSRASAR